jgi:hypothetical protein
MSTLEQVWGNYEQFVALDQRIMHHAIMNILEPIFERQMICHSYACRKGKGTHAAVLYAFHQCKSTKYYLKMDIRKYFDSINHDDKLTVMLNGQQARKRQGRKVLFSPRQYNY